MYIPACPLTEANAQYLKRQREAFFDGTNPIDQNLEAMLTGSSGTPAPDFPSGIGESEHMGRLTPDFVMQNIDIEAQRAMGFTEHDSEQKDLPERERQVLQTANSLLGFT